MNDRTYTMAQLRAEIREVCDERGMEPHEGTARFFQAAMFPLEYGWDGVVDDIARDLGMEKMIETWIADAIEGLPGDHAGKIGHAIIRLALARVSSEYDDMVEGFLGEDMTP